jgi:hypothetical protein
VGRTQDSIEIVQNLVIPEPKHAIAAFRQFDAAALAGLLAKRMLPAVW